MFDYRTCALCLFLVMGCGEDFTATGDHGTGGSQAQSSGGSSTHSTGGETLSTATDVAGSTTSGGAAGTGGTQTSGGTGGGGGTGGSQSGFSAMCSGTVDCPDMPGCANWHYTVDDDGTTTIVTAGVELQDPGMSCSDQIQYASSLDAGMQVTGNITFPCNTGQWSFGMDRMTGLVYVKEMTMGYSWTPTCE